MKSLHIFVDSEQPDQHVNSLVYCVLHLDVRRVTFHHIRGLSGGGPPAGLSGRVLAAVQTQLEGLAQRGEYSINSGSRSGTRVQLCDQYGDYRAREIQSLYKRVRDIAITFSNSEVEYSDLRYLLRTIADERQDAYVDVTAIKKRYLGDVVATALVEGLEGLYTFDLTGSVDFERPWRMLIHELDTQQQPGFQYTNLLDTPVYRSCVRTVMLRAPRLRIAAGITIVLLVFGSLGLFAVGPESKVTQVVLAISGLASIISLVMVFFTPRGSS